ncbi:hypothetical protein OPQ81_006098 [Rhizoctonia solani]|nr:hypothetical protein OPQ81_006098 [Rhizoctonia solani]
MGRAISVPLTSALRGVTQTPGPANRKSKIPSPEKFDGKKGPAAKSFILDCKAYFLANPSSFQTDHSHISFVLMNLQEGQPKKWVKSTWKNSLMAPQNPSWLIGSHLKLLFAQLQTKSATDYATEFRNIASNLEWSDAALMSSFHQGLKKEVTRKLIKFTLYQNITTLDALISTARLVDDTLFEAQRETHGSSSSASSNKTPGNKSGDFVSGKSQVARRNAGECSKCVDKSCKWKD